MSTLLEMAEAVRAADLAATNSVHCETMDEHQACAAKRYVEYVLAKHKGNVTKAAAEAGKHRSHFYAVMNRLGVKPPRRRMRGNWGAS